MGAKNRVIAGDYNGKEVFAMFGDIEILTGKIGESLKLDKSTVENYEIIDENYQKSAASAVGRATVGALLLGPIGLVAGATAKNKGIHTIAIQFKDGRKSLIEIDDKRYKVLMKKMF